MEYRVSVWLLEVTTTVLCDNALETRQDKRCAMISPCQVADYWSLHLFDFDWLELYGSSAGFDWSSKSSNPIDWPLPMGYRWTIRSVSPTDRIIHLVWMRLKKPWLQLDWFKSKDLCSKLRLALCSYSTTQHSYFICFEWAESNPDESQNIRDTFFLLLVCSTDTGLFSSEWTHGI